MKLISISDCFVPDKMVFKRFVLGLFLLTLIARIAAPTKPANVSRQAGKRKAVGRQDVRQPEFKPLQCDYHGKKGKQGFPTSEQLSRPFLMLTYKKQIFFFFETFVIKIPGKDQNALTLRKRHECYIEENDFRFMTHGMPKVSDNGGKRTPFFGSRTSTNRYLFQSSTMKTF